MKLKQDELDMLNGKEGRLRQEAMKFLIKLGEVYGADEMVDIGFAFVYTLPGVTGKAPTETAEILSGELLEEAIRDGVKVKVPSIGGLLALDPEVAGELKATQKDIDEYYKALEVEKAFGIIPIASCAPYMVCDMNAVPFGTHMVTIESSAIPYYNSALGARVNRGGISSFCSAITGKSPKILFHRDENRFANTLINVTAPLKSLTDFGCLGLFAGEKCGTDTPVFSGIQNITVPDMISLSSAAATSGAVTLFHIPGVTPEFRTVEEALDHRQPQKVFEFGPAQLQEIYDRYKGTKGEPVNRIILGCPHYTIFQLQHVAEKIKGKKVAPGVDFVINTNPQTRLMAKEMGFDKIFKQAGVLLIAGTCQIIGCGCPSPMYCYVHPEYSSGTVVTDSLKAAVYSPSALNARHIILADTDTCIAAALSGKWGGE